MRRAIQHHRLNVYAIDAPDSEGVNHAFEVPGAPFLQVGPGGVEQAALLAIIIDQFESAQKAPSAVANGNKIIGLLRNAMELMNEEPPPVGCYEDPMRGTGRTTGLMLKAIGDALLTPGKWIHFVDHAEMSSDVASIFAENIKRIADSVGLQHLVVAKEGKSVALRSDAIDAIANQANLLG